MMYRLVAVPALAFALTACTGTSPSGLSAPKTESWLDLKEPIIYVEKSSAQIEITIASGTYTALREDLEGTYYQGPSACYRSKVLDPGWALSEASKGQVTTQDCGIYLPRDAKAPAKLYLVIGTIRTGHTPSAAQDVTVAQTVGAVVSSQPAMASATPMQAGVGTGVGMGVVAAIIETEKGRFIFPKLTLDGMKLRAAAPVRESK